ncbi:hypothetical protein [Nocardioides houyundeii]|uniref:hypothetical protein n=1 Tax=Nocardioides houyundeii TaxID=2045452 RepID=UPI000C75ABAE|nr:hypothetical protein [Nocardioides houyundeii]
MMCKEQDEQGRCWNPLAALSCLQPPGTVQYKVLRQPLAGGEWTEDGTVCLGNEAEIDVQGQAISTAMVTTAVRNLTWPAAQLNIQPVDGETLVNLDTIFYTDSTTPVTKNLTLLGQAVTIEATPTSYTWHWTTGDDDAQEPLVTTHGGGAYPNQTITHRYQDADTTAHPRLDVTYTGRYRVGNSGWTPIPTTRTIQGTPQALSVLEARPTLVR